MSEPKNGAPGGIPIEKFYNIEGSNVTFLNGYARGYYIGLNSAHKDLQLVFCTELWPDYVLMTTEALWALHQRVEGKLVITDSPISAQMAVQISDTVLTTHDIQELAIK